MATFTVFAFGTGERRNMKKKNIISQFSEACTGNHTVIEGPDFLGRKVSKDAKQKSNDIITWLMNQNNDENTINLTGFSRGSVTCMRIANRLKWYETSLNRKDKLSPAETKLLRRLKATNINIFAIDPVAGLSDKSHAHARVIPDNVKSFVAILQMDEMRRDFKPQDMSRIKIASPLKTKLSLLPMYGNHSDSTKIKNQGMQSGPTLVWYALHKFLTQHGTTFKDDKTPKIVKPDMTFSELPEDPTSKDLLKLFTLHHQERNNYLNSGKAPKLADGIPLPRKIRTLNSKLEFYVKNSDFFTNQLERELFKITYPKVFNYLFEMNQLDSRFPEQSACDKENVIAELSLLKQENPALFARLNKFGIKESEESIILGQPSGVNCLEPCASLLQIYPERVPDSVKECAREMSLLENLEAEVNRVTFQYEREKSNLSPFTARAQAGYTKTIRDQVYQIIYESEDNRNTKYSKVLDNLEQHYMRFIRSKSGSELTDTLETLLKNHGRDYTIVRNSIPRQMLGKFIRLILNLLKEVISFIGNLGHIGGGILSFVGRALMDIGTRCNDLLGTLGYNPLKYLASAIAYAFVGIGYALKHSFGLKPLTQVICNSIKEIRNEIVIAIGEVTVSKVSSKGFFGPKVGIDDPNENLGNKASKPLG